jgi:hypothetical protein
MKQWTIKMSSPFFLFLAWQPSWMEAGITGADLGYYASLWTAFLGISSINLVSLPGQRPCELLPSDFVRRPSYVVSNGQLKCHPPFFYF